MPSRSLGRFGSGRRGGSQCFKVLSHALKSLSKFVVTILTRPSLVLARSIRIRCAIKSQFGFGFNAEATFSSMSSWKNPCSRIPKIRSAETMPGTPTAGPIFFAAFSSFAALLSGCTPSDLITLRARPKKSGKFALALETPAPQKNTTRPSSLARRRSSGIEGPFAINLNLLS